MRTNIGTNIATWCFDQDASIRKRQYAQLEAIYPDKYIRFLQSGYTYAALFPWYSKDHEETVLKELKEREWKSMWCLLNDNPVFAGTSLTSSERRKRVVEALSLEMGVTSGAWDIHNLLLTEVSCEAYRLRDIVDVFELVNADIQVSTINSQALSLAIQRVDGVPGYKIIKQGGFLYDYRRKPTPDVRITGYSEDEKYSVISEFGVEASTDKENLKDRMSWIMGALAGRGVDFAFHHEYVSRAWGWDTWRTVGGTEVLWDEQKYREFLKQKGTDEGAHHSKYVSILRPEILSALKRLK